MAIVKVLEILSDSNKSWEEAAQNAVSEASKTVKNIKSVYVQDQSCVVKDGKITAYRVNVKVSFLVNT